jgi:hypothetical protein
MRRVHITPLLFSILVSFGSSCQIANAGDGYDECVMGLMYGQGPYMLPRASKICRDQFPPQPPPPAAPTETILTQQINYDLCSQPGEELAICINNPPDDKFITRVIAYLTNASPCVISYDGQIPYTSSSYADHKTHVRYNPVELSEGLFLTTGSKSMFSNTYYFIYNEKMKEVNCYRIEILGYENCSKSVFSWNGYSCH